MTTANSTTSPAAEELQVWTEQVRDFLETNNRKRITTEMKADLLAQGARWCGTCRTVKAVTEYNKNASMPDGLNSLCRNCKNGVDAEWREANPEYFRTYNAEHREERSDYDRTMYATNEMRRLRIQLSNGYRRAVEAGNPAELLTAEQILAYWEERGIDPLVCIYTGEKLTPQNRSLDHCTPIGRGGSHQLSNLVPASFDANYAKRNRTALEYMADRAAAQDPEELPELVRKAMETSSPVRSKRVVAVQIEEGADHE